ncbi:MAG TPA: 50S ribosomal protein L25 [Candidatus Saccharibacteria bacterium]|jgi:large subunit ribosomal protein L25|nr:large subunit ribosomal protein [Patescibacteria group bacterium]HMS31255.1 50S ribosomal protein L25 [Candidatus Saccharibacteria bacterium]
MSQDVQLKAEKREGLGKKAVTALRATGKVPAVIQEHGKESLHIMVDGREILKAFAGAGKSQAIDLTVEGSKVLALIKEIEFVNLKPEVEHVVFQALNAKEVVDAEVPVHIVGEIPAETNRLVLLHTLETIEVRALPKDLPEALEVSGASLVEVDDKVVIGDIKLPEGVELVELLSNADDEEKREEFLNQPIAIVKEPSMVESDEGVELEEGASEADAVEADKGGDTDQGGTTESENPGGKKAKEDHGE